jgi:hypothetical protein
VFLKDKVRIGRAVKDRIVTLRNGCRGKEHNGIQGIGWSGRGGLSPLSDVTGS